MDDLFENLEQDDKKLVEWLQHMYGCWEKRLTGEEWAAEFQAMKDAMESEKEAYLYVTGQLLALAARNDDLDTFRILLDCGGYRWYCLQSVNLVSCLFRLRYNALKKKLPWLSDGPFITEKEEFLDEIVRRHGSFADIPWGDELSQCIMDADRKIRMMICRYHPELPFFIPVWTIIWKCDVILLKAYLEECSRTGRDAQEELLSAEMPGLNVPKSRLLGSEQEGRNAALFYRYAFSRLENRGLRKRFLRVMFMEFYFLEERSLIRLFQKYIDAEDDFADYLNVKKWDKVTRSYIQGWEALCRIYKEGETEHLPVSIHVFSQELCKAASDGGIRRILDIFCPVGLQNRVDELTREILRRGSKELLEKAIRRGFVTAANREALLAESGRLQCGKKIRVMLMGVPCGETLAERYRQQQ